MALTVIRDQVSSTILMLLLDSDPTVTGTANPNPDPGTVLLVRTDVPSVYYKSGAAATAWTLLASAAAAGSSSQSLIYRPGGVPNGPTIFNTWSDLVAEITSLRAANNGGGLYTIEFDDSVITPAVVPVSVFNMKDVTWTGRLGRVTRVNLADGCKFPQLRRFADNLLIHSLSLAASGPVVDDLANGDFIEMIGCDIDILGGGLGAAFFDGSLLIAGDIVTIAMTDGSSLDMASKLGGRVCNFPILGSTLVLFADNFSAVNGPCLFGAAGAVLTTLVDSLTNQSTVFANWAGTISTPFVTSPPSLVPRPYLAASSAIAIAAPNFSDWLRVAAPGAIVQPLPSINAAPSNFRNPGCMVVVTGGGVGPITVSPAAGDTINTSAAPVQARGSIILMSDGISDWTTIGGANYGVPIVQRYVCTGAEGAAFTVALAVARSHDQYSVYPTLAGVTAIFGIDCPDVAAGDRTTAQFNVVTTAAVAAGDIIDFLLINR